MMLYEEKFASEIMQICDKKSRNTLEGKLIEEDVILQEFSRGERSGVKSVIKQDLLKNRQYLRKINDIPTYAIAVRGENYIGTKRDGLSFNIGNNSNVAINSPGAMQNININDQPLEIQELVSEFDNAIKIKDVNKIKAVFGYIVDKSVDVAIAIAMGLLLR